MIRNRLLLKALAVFFIMEMLMSSVVPAVTWALTSGPTAPEATSFEPVDTTDMVNLVTGDFVYNLPLLEVPGPGGGYPLSLSYHAGIKLDQDASWVGLGWTLNPGAINRSVNGYADDNQMVTGMDRSFWEGGSSSSFTIAASVGNGALTAGLVFAEDTYRGSGVGYFYGTGMSERMTLGNFVGVSNSLQRTWGVSPYGDRYSSSGVSVGIAGATKIGMSLAANAGASIDQDGKAVGSFKYDINNLGASMSTDGSRSFSIGGIESGVNNDSEGRISTSGYNYSANIPLGSGLNLHLKKSYQRYWSDEKADVLTNGSLYFPSVPPSTTQLDKRAFDVYDLQYADAGETPPDEMLAGSFIDYDSYSVLAQGLSGGIRPFHYKSYLLHQNKIVDNKYKMKSYPLGLNPKASFRFVGDFSNRYEHDASTNNFTASTSGNPLSFAFDPSRITGENQNDGYDVTSNVLPGSKHVDWFTNIQINDNERTDQNGQPIPPGPDAAIAKKFINCKALGFTRSDDSQIGGFKVTNESGVTYHYALPVYSSDEHQYTGRQDEQGNYQCKMLKKPQKYAYTWLLTTVTGPDFVDTNLNGYADNADWGHWVNFEYGKWSGSYSWRNPASGFNKDIDHNFNTFSKGKKEVYYLNAIRTKTHTALFVKELRADGKGVVHKLKDAIQTNSNHDVTAIDDGSFQDVQKVDVSGNPYTEQPVSTLRLHSIYLMQNKDLLSHEPISNLATIGNIYYHSQNLSSDLGKFTYGDNVLDVHDISSDPIKSDLKSKCLKKIEFKTDYSLAAATPNSYWSELDVLNTSQPTSSSMGKLTLNSVAIYGRGESNLLPEIKFSYEDERIFHAGIKEEQTSEGVRHRLKVVESLGALDFRRGEIIHVNFGIRDAYGYVSNVIDGTNEIQIKFYQGAQYVVETETAIKANKTKNPPYLEDFHDLWQNFKVDLPSAGTTLTEYTENVRRMTSSTSAQSVDVWSLREIKTTLGAKIKIQYESDKYRSALKSLSNLPIKAVEPTPDGRTKVFLYHDLSEYGLDDDNITTIKMRLVTAKRYDVNNPSLHVLRRFYCNGVESTYIYQWYLDDTWGSTNLPVTSKGLNYLVVDYDYTDRYPSNGNCIEENPPYGEEGASSGNAATCIPLSDLTASDPIFLGGEIIGDFSFSSSGGDLRVKRISLEQLSETRSTKYEYLNGITSYEPLGISVPIARINANLNSCLLENQKTIFEEYREKSFNGIYAKFKALFSNSRELPAPGVLYEWVRVSEDIARPGGTTQLQGKSEYQFEVFSPETLDLSTPGGIFLPNPSYQAINQPMSYGNTSFLSNYNDPSGVFGLPVNKISATSPSNPTKLEDFSAIMGSLKQVVLYDDSNHKISETVNHYLHDNFTKANYLAKLQPFGNQGKIMETFADARILPNSKFNPTDPDTYTLHAVLSQKINYPSVQTGYTTKNYRTGIETRYDNLAFDFYSGQPTRTKVVDGYGSTFISETTPAYRMYPDMGFAYLGKKNMLTQTAVSTSYKVSNTGAKLYASAGATTWSKDIPMVIDPSTTNLAPANYNVWRPSATYMWKGDDATLTDGLYPESGFSSFNFANPTSSSTQWQKVSENKLSDVYSNVLETTDINANYSTARMSSDQALVLATATNAGYNDVAFSSAEDNVMSGKFGGNVSIGNGQVVNNQSLAHTGSKSLLLNANVTGFTYQASKATLKNAFPIYHASVWARENSAGVLPAVSLIAETNGGVVLSSATALAKYKAGSWYLISLDFSLPSSTDLVKVYVKNTSAQSFYVDDFRVHPQNASMVGYVYNKWGELSHILNNNNLFTEFRYDGMGRLKETFKETFTYGNAKTSETIYHYAGQP